LIVRLPDGRVGAQVLIEAHPGGGKIDPAIERHPSHRRLLRFRFQPLIPTTHALGRTGPPPGPADGSLPSADTLARLSLVGAFWKGGVTILGGCGHVGLPLGLALADSGVQVTLYDNNMTAVDQVQAGKMPHLESGAREVLLRTLADGNLTASVEISTVGHSEYLIVVIGTPVDEHLNPDPQAVITALEGVADELVDGQTLILRSTVFPGVTKMVERLMERLGKSIDVAFCPERIAEGRAMEELLTLPQIVAARSDHAYERAASLFGRLTNTVVRLEPEEAELAKLFTNSYRYIKFAAANQLYMMANDFGLDYERIRAAVVQDYPRAADLPGSGFAAGPCLLKDTMQLAAFNNNNFALGLASMQINEGLPLYLVSRMESRYDLDSMTVGILGMAFKSESDDNRSSLSYKLKRVLKVRAHAVLTTDPFVTVDDDLLPLDVVLDRSDLIVIGAPHRAYAEVEMVQPVVDVWNLRGNGVYV
jgi:UDP-N-acetyl-D-mannosaminuronic acid dehydrogenase